VADCLAAHGERPAAYLDRLGLLGERTVLAHGVWLDRAELELIAERGATVVANPVANMKLAVGGVLPYPAARRAGVPVGLGTDGAGSNDSLDLLADLKAFALTQRHAAGDPTVIPAEEALEIATGARAPLLGGGAEPLSGGAPADFLLLRGDSPELGIGDLASDLVYAASGSVVDTTVVAGRVLMRGGEVEGCDEIVARARERSRRLGIGSS
jgi:5-methylthioadenosine/S-adenosylhomocysteine deaminase